MEQFLLITLLLNFDGTVVAGNHENGFPPKVLVSEAECKYLKHQYEFMRPPVGLKYLSTAYICERKYMIIASGYNAQATSIPTPAVTSRHSQEASQRRPLRHPEHGRRVLSLHPTAATYDMDTSTALLLMHEGTVKCLFVPVIRRGARGSS